ncbi:hypothetical protein [Coraliomargarita parva]|uniref:hypothetical protein n=1 Tax=Coraliomargarita parva TaxID=3014050 RepID=UPI0022B57F13|nr:hypothetical protein [Coraliomargarita parva]
MQKEECISQIREAFKQCEKPSKERMSSWGGLDGDYVLKNWNHLKREQVREFDSITSYHTEDLSYMSSDALRYYLPGIMILFLEKPDVVDYGAFIGLLSRLEAIFGCRVLNPNKIPLKFDTYRPIRFTQEQLTSITNWTHQIETLYDELEVEDEAYWFSEQFERLRKAIGTSRNLVDYDIELKRN